jgi:thioredoxin reductase (NADPH)
MRVVETEIAVVGAGPAGLAAARALQSAGRGVAVFDRGAIAEHVSRYPTYMTFFSTADLLELDGFPLIIAGEKPSRREYLNYLRRFVKEMRLDARTGCEIVGCEGEKGAFRLSARDRSGEGFDVRAERVVLATGAYASPQRLGVPGEDLPKVSHYFTEVHPYFGSRVLIVGGGNSAAETALELWRAGVEVAICHRRAKFKDSIKYWLAPDLENRVKNGEIRAFMPARVVEIRPRSVVIRPDGAEPTEIENDFVLALTGYRPDPGFLSRFGVSIDAATGRPRFDETTLESERPGVYMVGVMLAGNVSSEIFIENSRTHGERIVAHLANGATGEKPK